VVTGGASGIGLGIASALVARGADVVVADIDPDAVREVGQGLGVAGIVCDVADADSVADLAHRVDVEHGGAAIVVANAGVGSGAAIADMTLDDWRWMLGVNLFGVVHTVAAFLPQLRRDPARSHLAVTASMAALAPSAGLGAYAAAKAGVVALAEALAAEHREEGLGVTIALPGPTRTRIAHSQRSRADRGGLADVDLEQMGFDWLRWRDPADVGRDIVDAIQRDDRYLATHPELWTRFADRVEALRAGFSADRVSDQ
jgi:NAD(P)-dependent dehydrogenase (short-subunit alcohol dehydrogenase family)